MLNQKEINNLSNAFNNFGKAMSEVAYAFVDLASKVFSNTWDVLKKINLDKQLSRKKFIKILMSKGIQRNEANKIAWEIHQKYGKYTVGDLLSGIKK